MAARAVRDVNRNRVRGRAGQPRAFKTGEQLRHDIAVAARVFNQRGFAGDGVGRRAQPRGHVVEAMLNF